MSLFRKEYRPLSADEKIDIALIKQFAEDLLPYIERVGDPRARALAITKLEECVMWATKGITG